MCEGEQGEAVAILNSAERIANSVIPSLIGFQQTRLPFFDSLLESVPVGILLNKNAVKGVF